MSTAIRSVRHREVMGSFTGGSFTPSRQARDAARPKPAPVRKLQGHRDTASGIEAAAAKLTRDAIAATGTFQRMNDSLDRVATGLRAIADQRRAAAAADRDADLSAIAHYRGVTPAAVNAANRGRWGRA